jgi:hypothetical protein
MLIDLPHSDIADSISSAIQTKGWTLEECCLEYNRKYKKDIKNNDLRPLNKDFLSRIKRKRFEVLSSRIVKLCEFLNVPTTKGSRDQKNDNQPLIALSHQIHDFEQYLSNNPSLSERFSGLVHFLSAITNTGTTIKETN